MSPGLPSEDPPDGPTLPLAAEVSPAEPPPLPSAELTPTQRWIERRERLEKEFVEVKRVVVFYAAMLGPLLGLLAWVYHARGDAILAEYSGGGALYAVIVGYAWLWRDELIGKLAWPRGVSVRIWAVVALMPGVTVASAFLLSRAVRALGFPQPQNELLQYNWPPWFCYLWFAALPAFFEEVAFRGLLLAKLQRIMRPVQAAWVTAILFGILHFNVLGLAVFLVPLALVAAWLTRQTHSLWPAILLHFLHNAAVATLMLAY